MPKNKRLRAHALAALSIGSAILLQGCTRSMPETVIDTHFHVQFSEPGANLDDVISQMDKYDISHAVVMEAPSPVLRPSGSVMTQLLAFFQAQTTRFKFLYGGADLQPILHGLGRSNAATLTLADLYPNGGGSEDDVTSVKTVAASPATYTTQFQTNATAAADSGSYVGFGELAAYHASRRSGHPFIIWTLNSTLMKWLADLAAARSMFIDMHVEGTDEKITEFGDLLAHNRGAKIVWQHAGWGETGGASADVVQRMMEQHSNLYLGLKVRPPESGEMETSSMFDERGRIKAEWVRLIKAYSSRIMLGLDVKMFNDGDSASKGMMAAATTVAELLVQLPKAEAETVASGTARGLLGL